jgi:hypothetical protein
VIAVYFTHLNSAKHFAIANSPELGRTHSPIEFPDHSESSAPDNVGGECFFHEHVLTILSKLIARMLLIVYIPLAFLSLAIGGILADLTMSPQQKKHPFSFLDILMFLHKASWGLKSSLLLEP